MQIDFNLFNAYICTMDHGEDCGCSCCQIDSAFINKYPKDEYSIQMNMIGDELKRRSKAINDKDKIYTKQID